MYSKVMGASGVNYPEIIDRLVIHGLARADPTPHQVSQNS